MNDDKPHGRQVAPANPGGARTIGEGRKETPATTADEKPAPRRRHQAGDAATKEEV